MVCRLCFDVSFIILCGSLERKGPAAHIAHSLTPPLKLTHTQPHTVLKVTEQVKAISERWKALDDEGRRSYLERAAADKARYQAEKAALAAVGVLVGVWLEGGCGGGGWDATVALMPCTCTYVSQQAKAKAAVKSKKKGGGAASAPGPREVDNEMHFPIGAFMCVCA